MVIGKHGDSHEDPSGFDSALSTIHPQTVKIKAAQPTTLLQNYQIFSEIKLDNSDNSLKLSQL